MQLSPNDLFQQKAVFVVIWIKSNLCAETLCRKEKRITVDPKQYSSQAPQPVDMRRRFYSFGSLKIGGIMCQPALNLIRPLALTVLAACMVIITIVDGRAGTVSVSPSSISMGDSVTASWSGFSGQVNLGVYTDSGQLCYARTNFDPTATTNQALSTTGACGTGWTTRSDYRVGDRVENSAKHNHLLELLFHYPDSPYPKRALQRKQSARRREHNIQVDQFIQFHIEQQHQGVHECCDDAGMPAF